ncbi:helix-turn-helix domain-containing protein [Streptomyces albidochromogenes]|nr:helix-turn-helix transcriptional regulator [Streptomyces albidochromogenes]
MKPMPDDLPEGRKEFVQAVRKELEGSKKSLRAIARDAHVSPGHISLIASGKRKPSEAALDSILRATGPAKDRHKGSCGGRPYLTKSWRSLLVAAAWLVAAFSGPIMLLISAMDDTRTPAPGPMPPPPTRAPTPQEWPPESPHPDPSPGPVPGLIFRLHEPTPLYEDVGDTTPKAFVEEAYVAVECSVEAPDGETRYRITFEWAEERAKNASPSDVPKKWYVDGWRVTLYDPETEVASCE